VSYVGTHPSGRRFYVTSKSGTPLAFVVFRRLCDREWIAATESYLLTPRPQDKWERVSTVEDRPYPKELHRVDGCYVPLGRDMTPREKAEEDATWWREIGHSETIIVELREATGQRTEVT
jgi:hypothetical protein